MLHMLHVTLGALFCGHKPVSIGIAVTRVTRVTMGYSTYAYRTAEQPTLF